MIAALLALGTIAQAPADGMTLDEVLERHQRYLDRIHTVDATIEIWDSKDGGATWSMTAQYHQLKDGPRERLTLRASGSVDQGGVYREKAVRVDASYTGEETRHLQGWDAEHPPAEPPSPANRYHGASAQIGGAPRDETISRQPALLMMLAPTYEHYLPGAVRSGSNASLERVMLDGRTCWEIRFDTTVGIPASYRVTLDPRLGFAMVRHEARSKTSEPAGGVSEAVEFREVEQGLFIPVRIRGIPSGQPNRIVERRVTSLKVNEPVAAEALTVKFPEDIAVSDTRTVPVVVSIWGTDGPKLTFKTSEEYRQYIERFLGRKPASLLGWFLGATAVLVAVAAVLLVVRRRIGRAA